MPGSSPEIAVVGAGPAGLMAAETASAGGAAVTVYERMPSAGRKLLLAGRGGLNLTHSEPLPSFLARYGEAAPALRGAIEAFTPETLRTWAEGLGQETFVGSSGRVFPKAMKSSPLLRAWLGRLGRGGVRLRLRHHWRGWEGDGRLRFETADGPVAVCAGAVVLALGGASWPRLGSDGSWVAPLAGEGIAVAALRPANCGFLAGWSAHLVERFAGAPLKRIAITHGGRSVKGEAVLTRAGLEGGAIYALSGPLRASIDADGHADILLDLRPDLASTDLEAHLSRPRGRQSLATHLRKAAGLAPVATALIHEVGRMDRTPAASLDAARLARLIKALPIRLSGIAGLERAISTAGGIRLTEVSEGFMLTRRPGVFVAGEMLDWDAPTGGYLLQASFATGAAAGRGALEWLARPERKR